MNRLRLLLVAALACASTSLFSMTIKPPTLAGLVTKSSSVVRTEVLETRCEERGEGTSRRIVTVVKVRVEKAIVGQAPAELELVVLGGEIGNRGLRIPGMTTFKKGDRDILFLASAKQAISPLVSANHGRYALVRKPGSATECVARADNAPVRTTADIEQAMECAAEKRPTADDVPEAMSVEAFEEEIVACAKEQATAQAR